MRLVIKGDPKTKKNSSQVVIAGGRHRVIPSPAYRVYRDMVLWQIGGAYRKQISYPVNVKAVYFMQTRRRVDLVNLLEATLDILVDAGVLEDDNSRIVVSHDGSRVAHDPYNPRVEIDITEVD